jgi:quercetin dioxygenase-like cupin family protein
MAGKKMVVNSDEGAILRVVGDTIRVLASGADTDGAYEVFDFQGPRDSGPPLHLHPWNEAYVIMEGKVEVMIGESKMTATPGCFVNIPAGTPHAYKILSEGARFIVMTNPAGASALFTELDRETGGSVKEIGKIVEVALRHGLTISPPPAAQGQL